MGYYYGMAKQSEINNRKDLIKKGRIVTDEIGIKMENSSFVLPCGITTKWENGGI